MLLILALARVLARHRFEFAQLETRSQHAQPRFGFALAPPFYVLFPLIWCFWSGISIFHSRLEHPDFERGCTRRSRRHQTRFPRSAQKGNKGGEEGGSA